VHLERTKKKKELAVPLMINRGKEKKRGAYDQPRGGKGGARRKSLLEMEREKQNPAKKTGKEKAHTSRREKKATKAVRERRGGENLRKKISGSPSYRYQDLTYGTKRKKGGEGGLPAT